MRAALLCRLGARGAIGQYRPSMSSGSLEGVRMTRIHYRPRQSEAQYRERLNYLLSKGAPTDPEKRLYVDPTKYRPQASTQQLAAERLIAYGRRRAESAARVMALGVLTREVERLDLRPKSVSVAETGVIWQAFQGTKTDHACHTVPTCLKIDGLDPTLITSSIALKRNFIVEYADCMLMPDSINRIDRIVDDKIGRDAFAFVMFHLLNEKGADWWQGFDAYRDRMREVGVGLERVIHDQKSGVYVPDDVEQRRILDAMNAVEEGLLGAPALVSSVEQLVSNVTKQVGSDDAGPGVSNPERERKERG